MRKSQKCLISLLALFLSFVLVACGNHVTNGVENNDTTPTNSTTNVTSSSNDISFANMLPDHSQFFRNGDVTVIDSDGGTSYCISIKNITKDEYDAYKNACSEGTFNKTTFDGETMFQARNQNEEYYVSLQYWVESEFDDSQNSINITCGVVKK